MSEISSAYPPFVRLINRLKGSGTGALLVRAAGGSFSLAVLSTAIAFFSNMLLARLMGVSQYGIYVYALGWINLLVLPATLGYANALVRFVPAYRAQGELGLLRGLLRQSFRQVMLAGAIGAVAVILTTEFLGTHLRPELVNTFRVAALMLPLLALTNVRAAVLRGLHRVLKAAVATGIIRAAVLLCFALAFYLVATVPLRASWTMTINLLGASVALLSVSFWLGRTLPAGIDSEKAQFATREWLFVALPLLANGAMNLLMQQSDVLMLGLLDSTDSAGIYAVTTRIGALVLFGLTAVNSILAPLISELHVKQDKTGLQRVMTRGAWLTASVALPAVVTLYLAGPWLLKFFGEGFAIGYTPLAILLVGYTFNALSGSVGFVMTMTGHHKQAFVVLAGSTTLNLVLNALLIPHYGMAGAAVATAVAMISWNTAMLIYVWRRFRINPTITAGSPL